QEPEEAEQRGTRAGSPQAVVDRLAYGREGRQGNLAVQRLQLALHRDEQRGGVAGGPDDEGLRTRVALGVSFVDVGLRVLAEEGIFRVPGDAHDLGPGLAGAEEVEALAQRVALRPELLGHRLVDDGDLRAA